MEKRSGDKKFFGIGFLAKAGVRFVDSKKKNQQILGIRMEPISNQYDLVLFVLLVLSFCVGMFTILYSKNESVNRGILLSTSTFGHKGLRIPFELLESFVEYFPYFAYLLRIENGKGRYVSFYDEF